MGGMDWVDLRSDTITRPTPAMRAAGLAAPVGDDVFGDDPTVNALQERLAAELGFERGLFVASGTQSNLVALMAHCERGDEYLVGSEAHTYKFEGGGAAVLGSIQPQPVPQLPDGTLPLDALERAIKPPGDSHFARTRLLALENTWNGRVLPPDYVGEAGALARTARPWLPPRRRAPVQRRHRERRRRRAKSRAASTASRSVSPRAWAHRWVRCCWVMRRWSNGRGAGARWSAAAGARPACWRRWPRMRSTTTSRAWPTTMRARRNSAEALRALPGLAVDGPHTEHGLRHLPAERVEEFASAPAGA
jgi:threonine aldolase